MDELNIFFAVVAGAAIHYLILWAIIKKAAGTERNTELNIASFYMLAKIAKKLGVDEKEVDDLIKYASKK